MRKTLTTAALLLALCCPAFAGETHTPGSPTPPPPGPATTTQPTTDGVMLEGETTNLEESDTLTQVTLELLAVLPSLF